MEAQALTEQELFDGILYRLPPVPAMNEIAGYDEPRENQKWKPIPEPDYFYGLSRDECAAHCRENPEAMAHALRMNEYCVKGYWFFCNGAPTYITGDHFFYLNFFKLDVGLPDYRDVDRRWFYMEDFCDKDPYCLGFLFVKKRRDGFSYRAMACSLNEARTTFNARYGMISKKGKDAKKLFKKMVFGFRKLPEWMKPQVQSAENMMSELVFGAPPKRGKNKGREEIGLDTSLDWLETQEDSYDGEKLQKAIADEAAKWITADFSVWLEVAKTCLTIGERIIGKLLVGSSINEPDDSKLASTKTRVRGSTAFKEQWNDSDYTVKDETGRTTSGLYRYFVPAYDGFEGYFGPYGESVIETPTEEQREFLVRMGCKNPDIGSREYLELRRAHLKKTNSVKYYEECRQRPFTVKEAFIGTMNSMPALDIMRIQDQIAHNNEYYGVRPQAIRRGNFVWANAVRDSFVEWQDDSNGKFLVTWWPKTEHQNKHTMRLGYKWPGNIEMGVFGCDPVDQSITKSNKRSDASAHGFLKYNVMMSAEVPPESFVVEYINRPPDVNIFFEDMLMMCVYYGWQLAAEANKPGLINYFKTRGYRGYLWIDAALGSPDWHKKWEKGDFGAYNTGTIEGPFRSQFVERLQSYVYNKIGFLPSGLPGYCPFNRLLESWSDFEPTERWTEFDATVSSGMALMAAQTSVSKFVEAPKEPIRVFDEFAV